MNSEYDHLMNDISIYTERADTGIDAIEDTISSKTDDFSRRFFDELKDEVENGVIVEKNITPLSNKINIILPILSLQTIDVLIKFYENYVSKNIILGPENYT